MVDALKRDLLFRRLNLLNPTFPFQRRFHAVFCRNVMIYFDRPTKRALVDRIAQFLVPGGVLFVGLSESLQDLGTSLRHVRPGVYVKS